MKYLIMIYHNPRSRELWRSFSEAERAEGMRAYAALSEDLAASGELIVAEALAEPSTGKGVAVRDGRTVTSDGPYAELKEHLAGFFLIECDGIERAIEYAARVPEASVVQVEVRPVLDPGGMEM